MRAVHTFILVADPTSEDVVDPSDHLPIFQLWFKLWDESFRLVYRELIVDVPVDPRVMVDVCIDGTIAFHESEPIPREEMTALAKLQEEAGLEESNMI